MALDMDAVYPDTALLYTVLAPNGSGVIITFIF